MEAPEVRSSKLKLLLVGLVIAALAGLLVLWTQPSRRVDFLVHLPDRPFSDEIFRGIEIALEEQNGRAGPYRVRAVRDETRGERSLLLPGFKFSSCVVRAFPSPVPVEPGWGAYAISPAPDQERIAVLRWMKSRGLDELLILYRGARRRPEWVRLELDGAASIHVVDFDLEHSRDGTLKGSKSLVCLDRLWDIQRQMARLKAAGHLGPVLVPADGLDAAELKDFEGVFSCLAPRKALPEAFVREYRARHGVDPPSTVHAGYASCGFALRALAPYPLPLKDGQARVQGEIDLFDPWNNPVGAAEVCEFRGGLFRPVPSK